jgi:hypothetical protein
LGFRLLAMVLLINFASTTNINRAIVQEERWVV